MIQKETRTYYKTDDGHTFESLNDAEFHVAFKKDDVVLFELYAKPDLGEGRHGAKKRGYIFVHAKDKHKLFAEEFMYEKYGNKIDFVQGTYGSNAIIEAWKIKQVDKNKVELNDIDNATIYKLEENFVDHIFYENDNRKNYE